MDRQVDNTAEKNIDMPHYALDIISAFAERTVRRLWIVIIVLCLLLAASWAVFAVCTTEYTVVETEATTDLGGMAIASVMGGVEVGDNSES